MSAFACQARFGDMFTLDMGYEASGDRVARGVRISEGPRLESLRNELRHLLDKLTKPQSGAVMVALGPDGVMRLGVFRRELERVNRPIYEEIAERRQAGDLAEREDRGAPPGRADGDRRAHAAGRLLDRSGDPSGAPPRRHLPATQRVPP